ncbi:MAG: molybdopterin-dependent oxidoreductase [Chitinophagaceae bacterium]
MASPDQDTPPVLKAVRKRHSFIMRWTHWVNFPILAIMIWSGLLIYWANSVYTITIFGLRIFPFFPQGFFDSLHIPYRLAEGMSIHFLFMWFFAINGALYVLYTIFSGEWRQLVPNRRSFREAWQVLLHDLHIRRIMPPQDKYNAAQRIAYTCLVLMGAGSLITGLAIYKPVQFSWLTALCGGYNLARAEHFILTIGYMVFFVIHVVQVLLAGWNKFRSAVAGFEVLPEKEEAGIELEKSAVSQTRAVNVLTNPADPATTGAITTLNGAKANETAESVIEHSDRSPGTEEPESGRTGKTPVTKELETGRNKGPVTNEPESGRNDGPVTKESESGRVHKTPVKLVPEQVVNRRTVLSFIGFITLGIVVNRSWKWLNNSPVEPEGVTGGARVPLRRAMEQNERIFQETFSNKHLVKTYPKSMAAKNVRVNSNIGMMDPNYDISTWSLVVARLDGSQLKISMEQLMELPETEIVFDFKCVEGWDQISWWGGVKFSDFIERFGLQEEAKLNYVGLATPDQGYYVGLEREAALHPQTILAYHVNGEMLPYEHGSPLRLIIPVKYGIKNIKRIGSMVFSNNRPPDFWAENGYDYYSGL